MLRAWTEPGHNCRPSDCRWPASPPGCSPRAPIGMALSMWGNPYNQPTCTFKITEEQVEELYKELKKYLYEKEQPKVGGSNE